jgi:hypothetical protein
MNKRAMTGEVSNLRERNAGYLFNHASTTPLPIELEPRVTHTPSHQPTNMFVCGSDRAKSRYHAR